MNRTNPSNQPLWPYGITAALIAIPIVWVFFVVTLKLTTQFAQWPEADVRSTVFFAVAALSAIPLVLSLLDFAAARRAVLDIRGVRLDFSKFEGTEAVAFRETVRLPENIGVPGQIVTDTAPMQIVHALAEATRNEIVRIDIDAGNAWWTTRLLALSAGAARAGLPRVLVFVGRKENVEGAFLGWAVPRDVVQAILASDHRYRFAYNRAQAITAQLLAFGDDAVRPHNLVLHHEVQRYANDPAYLYMGAAVAEQILMDQLGRHQQYPPQGVTTSLEDPADHVTLGRLADLLEPYLYRDAIDLAWPAERQVATYLEVRAPFVALLRGGRYDGMLQRELADRRILRQLLVPPTSTR
jgi:hypothetical protein